jgi:putative redox protein
MSLLTASALFTDQERFLATSGSKHALAMDAGPDKTAPSPMELVLMALCGCTASDVVTILRKKREAFTSLEVRAEADRAPSPPKVYTAIRLTYRVGGGVSRKAMEDAVRLSKEKYCSVSAMLQRNASVTAVIEYI